MIKFFRKIRQKMLTENKFSKYLIYAIGEILLVVIGIMIALNVNNKSQEHAQEEEIKATLVEIQRDITRDIQYSRWSIGRYIERDSIKNLVMNDKVNYDDIKNERINAYSLAYYFSPMKLQTNGYTQFSNKIDKMPKKYKALLLELNTLYQFMGSDIEFNNNRFKEIALKNVDESYDQFEWYTKDRFNREMSEEQIDFYLHNPKFKAYAMHMFNEATKLFISVTRYRPKAIEMYFKIDEMLDGEGLETPDYLRNTSLADSTQAKPLLGYYEQVSGSVDSRLGSSIEITSRGKQLYLNSQDTEVLLHYYHPTKMQFYIEWSSIILKFNQNENEDLTVIGGRGDERRWRKVLKINK